MREQQSDSVFNGALEYLESIAKLQKSADLCAVTFNYEMWYAFLRRVQNRIDHKMNDKEEKQCTKFIEKIDELLEKSQKDSRVLKKSCISPLYKIMILYDNHLKRIMDNYSLLMPKSEDPRFALRNR